MDMSNNLIIDDSDEILNNYDLSTTDEDINNNNYTINNKQQNNNFINENFNEKDYGYQEIDNDINIFTKTSKDFNGFDYLINNSKLCFYCNKYLYEDIFIKNCEYCIHCWAWLNYQQVDLENGKYSGDLDYQDLKTKLKNTYHLHKNCNIKDCIYNKINDLSKNNKLHYEFCKLFNINIKENTIKKVYKIKKKRFLKINYNLSEISI